MISEDCEQQDLYKFSVKNVYFNVGIVGVGVGVRVAFALPLMPPCSVPTLSPIVLVTSKQITLLSINGAAFYF